MIPYYSCTETLHVFPAYECDVWPDTLFKHLLSLFVPYMHIIALGIHFQKKTQLDYVTLFGYISQLKVSVQFTISMLVV